MANPQRPEDGHAASPNAGRNAAVALSYDEADGAPRVVAKGYGQLADTIVRTAEKRPVRARVARTRRPAHAGRPGRAYSSPTVRCGGRIAGLAVSPGIARDSGRRRAARSIYLRNLHRVGRQRSGISAHPAGRHAFRAVRAHPPRQPHPGARRRRSRDRRAHPGADKHTRQFFWRPRDYAGADFEQSDSMGLLSGTTFHFHATAYGGVQIRFRCSGPT